VLVMPIYAAREENESGVSAADLVAAMAHHPDARYVAAFDQAVTTLLQEARSGDLVLTLGAGDGNRIGEQLLARLKGLEETG